jgi:asparagine synthase (glutamine-hydrolysing)
MFRYLAAVWNPKDEVQLKTVQLVHQRLRESGCPWSRCVEADGLTVWTLRDRYSTDDILLIGRNSGVLIGTLFTAGPNPTGDKRVLDLSHQSQRLIVTTRGEHLVNSFWGSYVLFCHDELDGTVCGFRGPMAALPCFHADANGVRWYVSNVPDLIALRLFRPSVNWPNIRAQALGADYLTRSTGINEISSLLPGEALIFDGRKHVQRTFWSPRVLSKAEPVTSFPAAVELMRTSAQRSINSWASLHRSVVVTISGGFDSSVIYAQLKEASLKPRVWGLNFYDDSSADERFFARSMSAKTGFTLDEVKLNECADLRAFKDCAFTAAPVLHFTAIDYEPACIRLADSVGATAIFSGNLGDDIFGRTGGPEVLADCLWRTGLGINYVRAAATYAEFRRVSVWRALSQGLRYRKLLRSMPYWSLRSYATTFCGEPNGNAHTLVSDDVAADYDKHATDFIHPWCRDIADMPPGWFQLVYSLVMTTSTWSQSPFSGSRDSMFHAPLSSQPLVEGFFRIPAAFHLYDGHSGAVARSAFGNLLSEEVRTRGRGKGSPDMWLIRVIERNRGFLMEFLSNGVLAKERIIDVKKVEQAVTRDIASSKIMGAQLIAAAYIEAWLRGFSDSSVRVAA